MGDCSTIEERIAVNEATPCPNKFSTIFPPSVGPFVAPGLLFIGMTVIGYGLSTGKKWATNSFISPSVQLTVMMLLMMADHGSTYWDHSRVSNEKYCLTSMLAGPSYDSAAGRTVFGLLSVLLAGVSVYGIKSKSVSLAATGVPFSAMMAYLAWSPEDFESCKTNALFTGLLAYGLDIMTFIGILQALFAASGNKNRSWEKWTVLYSVLISALFVVLIGRDSEYGDRITPGSCEINDEEDTENEKLVDRKPELYTGILFSIISLVYVIYLKKQYTEVSFFIIYPTIGYLLFDILTKLKTWRRGETLVGDSMHRSVIYTLVQSMDIMLSSSSLVSLAKDVGHVGQAVIKGPTSMAGEMVHLAGGSISYIMMVVKLVIAMITGKGFNLPTGTFKKLAEVVKLISLNIGANVFPLYIDNKNADFMITARPQTDLNVKCFVR